MAVEQQVFSEGEVDFGQYGVLFWNWSGQNSVVPANHTLEITSLTLNFFPTGSATVGRADIAGRDAPNKGTGNAVWRLQVVYVEPQKTVHLTFPMALKLKAGGHVEVGFVVDGPGKIFLSANGVLVGP